MTDKVETLNTRKERTSLRDEFAKAALAGGLEQGVRDDMDINWWRSPESIARRAYAIADAMLMDRFNNGNNR